MAASERGKFPVFSFSSSKRNVFRHIDVPSSNKSIYDKNLNVLHFDPVLTLGAGDVSEVYETLTIDIW